MSFFISLIASTMSGTLPRAVRPDGIDDVHLGLVVDQFFLDRGVQQVLGMGIDVDLASHGLGLDAEVEGGHRRIRTRTACRSRPRPRPSSSHPRCVAANFWFSDFNPSVVTLPMPLKQGGRSTSSPANSFSTRSREFISHTPPWFNQSQQENIVYREDTETRRTSTPCFWP